MIISKIVVLFIIYGLLGWIYETTYCTITNGQWKNRGFLFGPVCPIYGTGAIAMSAVGFCHFRHRQRHSGIRYFLDSGKIVPRCLVGLQQAAV